MPFMHAAFRPAGIKADWTAEIERVVAGAKVKRPRVKGEVKYFVRKPELYRPDLRLLAAREYTPTELKAMRFTRAYIWASVQVWPSGDGYKVPARLVVSPPPRGLLAPDDVPTKKQAPVITVIGLPVTRGSYAERGGQPLNMEEWSKFLQRKTGMGYATWSNAVMSYLTAKGIKGHPVDLIGYLPTESK